MPLSFSVHSNIRDYDVTFQPTPDFIVKLAQLSRACFIVDENVWNLYSATLLKNLPSAEVIILEVNEDSKTLETVKKLYDQLVTNPAKRNLTLVSFGGGILQDITGFTASTIYRGIKWIYVPTTLLAQADSCIGSKTSLNYLGYKNLIGTFYPPAQIHIYTPFLNTLQDCDYYSGFGEVMKLHLMGGLEYFREISLHAATILSRESEVLLQAIQTSLKIKLSYMAGDEFDSGRRNLLNYGHDFGHALESTSDFTIPHGQAVIFGMLAANLVARNRGLMDEFLETEIARNLLIPNMKVLPTPEAIEPSAIISALGKDKKRTGDLLALILMQNNFDFIRINDLTPDEVKAALAEIKNLLGK